MQEVGIMEEVLFNLERSFTYAITPPPIEYNGKVIFIHHLLKQKKSFLCQIVLLIISLKKENLNMIIQALRQTENSG